MYQLYRIVHAIQYLEGRKMAISVLTDTGEALLNSNHNKDKNQYHTKSGVYR